MREGFEWLIPFNDANELAELVEKALQDNLPSNWGWSRWEDEQLRWAIEPDVHDRDQWDEVEYSLFVTSDLHFLIITHDNTDAGPLSPWHFAHRATVINACGTKLYGLETYLQEIFATCEPNRVCVT
jgi:hypothetical protein